MSAFKKGDRVAWDHSFGVYAPGTILVADAAPVAPRGRILGPANSQGTWFEVELEGEAQPRILTAEELVRVAEEAK